MPEITNPESAIFLELIISQLQEITTGILQPKEITVDILQLKEITVDV